MQCKITFGRLVKNARQENGFSQRELCEIISRKYRLINRYELSLIENNRLEIRRTEYDWLTIAFAEMFNADIEWLQQIRQQTEPQPLDLSQAIFPIYFNRKP